MTKAARYSHDKLVYTAIGVPRHTTPTPSSLRQCFLQRTTLVITRNLPRDEAQIVQQQRQCLRGLRDGRILQSRSLHGTGALSLDPTDSQSRKKQTPSGKAVWSETISSKTDGKIPLQIPIRKYTPRNRRKSDASSQDGPGIPAQGLTHEHIASHSGKAETSTQTTPAIPAEIPIRKYAARHPQELDTSLQTELGKPAQLRIRHHDVADHGTRNIANGVKYVFRHVPRDIMEDVPNIAHYRSKRREQAIANSFLGVEQLTKHDVVDRAVLQAKLIQEKKKRMAFEAKVIHQKNKSNPFRELLQNTEAIERRDQEMKQPQKDGELVGQTPVALAQQFDILSDIESKLQFSRTEDFTVKPKGSLEGDEPAANASEEEIGSSEPVDIDWDNLPLSPLMHQQLIKARTRFREAKLRPQDASAYNKDKGLELTNDYLAMMLASPIRTCRLTSGRLPKAFLLETQTRQHPETGQVWELPRALSPQNATVKSSSDVPTPDAPDSSASLHGPDFIREAQMVPLNADHITLSNNVSSYMLFTWFAVQTLSNLTPTRYKRTIPQRWRNNLGHKLASEIHWRQDMPELIHSLLQRQVIDELRSLSPPLGGGIVRACSTMNESGRQEIKSLPHFKGCAVLYFGASSNSTTQQTSFSSTIDAITATQTDKVEVLDDLFGNPQGSQEYSPLVRIRKENGENLLVFDMTRLWTLKFVQALAQVGYDQPVYHIADKPGAKSLHIRLWTLAHYIMLSGII